MTATPSEFGLPGAVAPRCVSERILAAASDLCTLVGVKHTTIADIARYADVDETSVRDHLRGGDQGLSRRRRGH
jgi:AcrR family transcriptional regulator